MDKVSFVGGRRARRARAAMRRFIRTPRQARAVRSLALLCEDDSAGRHAGIGRTTILQARSSCCTALAGPRPLRRSARRREEVCTRCGGSYGADEVGAGGAPAAKASCARPPHELRVAPESRPHPGADLMLLGEFEKCETARAWRGCGGKRSSSSRSPAIAFHAVRALRHLLYRATESWLRTGTVHEWTAAS